MSRFKWKEESKASLSDAVDLAKKIFKNRWVSKVGVTGSIAKRGYGKDIDLVVDIFPHRVKLRDAVEDLFMTAWEFARENRIRVDIFLEKSRKWSRRSFVRWLGIEDIEEYMPEDFCYFIITVFDNGGWDHGWWNNCLDTLWLFKR